MFKRKEKVIEDYLSDEEAEKLSKVESIYYGAKALFTKGLIPKELLEETRKNVLAQIDEIEKQYSCEKC